MTGPFPIPAAGFQWDPLTVERFPNGLTVVVKEDHAAPLAVTDVWFGVGSRQETDDQSGTAHFLEHMLFKGTGRRGPGEIAAEIEAFGGRTNAGTSIDYTHYYIACESHSLAKALEIHADIFRNAALDPAAIEAERGVILEEIKRAQDTPSRVLWDSLCQELFPRHPYRRPTLGTPETVRGKITPRSLREFFTTWYVPGNMAILVVGDVRTDEVLAQLRSWYGDLPAVAPPVTRLAPDELWTGCRTVRQEMDVDRGYLQLAFRTVSHANPEEAVGLDLLGVVAGLGRTSRLSVALREQASLVSQVGASQVTLIDDGMFMVRAEFDPADEDRVVDAVRAELARLHREPLPAAEVQKAREYLENLYLRSVETAEGKSEVLGNAVVRNALDEERHLLALVRSFTPERLQSLAAKHLAHDGHVLATLGPRPRFTELAPAPRRPGPVAGENAPAGPTAPVGGPPPLATP
ncbi:MAG: insulinase family protein, partial [Candidatus Riflebacteria bacterium]|nr:insulinase family protein [Candidatus Riflebacteria bacterium]